MKKKINLVIYSLVLVSTMISLFVVYTDVNHPFVFPYLVGYCIFLLSSFVYFIVLSIFNLKNAGKKEAKKRINQFVVIFLLLSLLNVANYYFYRPKEFQLYKIFAFPLGIAGGLAFLRLK